MSSESKALRLKGSWFRPELRKKNYDAIGDAYDDEKYRRLTENWNVDATEKDATKERYLTFVKQASNDKWIHLRLLADFMQIGSIPRDWAKSLRPKDDQDRQHQQKRWARTNICVLEYSQERAAVKERRIPTAQGGYLGTEDIRRELRTDVSEDASFRLYVVEDLSRNVIEALGTEFEIDPDFFRAHIVDYAWYNVRDRWREAQPLEQLRGRRSWFQFRYVTTRYFESMDQFTRANKEANDFNILRRLDDDNSKGWWDSKEAVVAMMRARATFWLKPKGPKNSTAIGKIAPVVQLGTTSRQILTNGELGVLLLDPTVSEGLPLWRGHRNFHPAPSFAEPPDQWPEWDTLSHTSPEDRRRHYFFEDFVYWAQQAEAFGAEPEEGGAAPQAVEHLPLQALLHLVGAEWLTLCEYIKTRLSQVELETVDPEHFAATRHVDVALGKLHLWRRLIPLYREMVAETIQHVFHLPCRAQTEYLLGGGGGGRGGEEGRVSTSSPPPPSIRAYKEDFGLVLAYLEECQARVDRLTSVVTAVMAVEDTRRANNDARNMGRLTWLATFFIPFSVVAGIFGIQHAPDGDMLRRYFEVTLPTIALTLAAGWAIHSPWVRAYLKRYWENTPKLVLQAALHGVKSRGQ